MMKCKEVALFERAIPDAKRGKIFLQSKRDTGLCIIYTHTWYIREHVTTHGKK